MRPLFLAVLLALAATALVSGTCVSESQTVPARKAKRDRNPGWELSVGHNLFPHEPRVTSMQVSRRFGEANNIHLFADVGYGLGSGGKKHGDPDSLLVGVSGGKRKNRGRYGIVWNARTGDVMIGARARLLGW